MVFRRSAFTRFPVRRRARANPKDGTLKVTSDQAQQNLARKVAKLSRSIRSIAPERKNFYQYVWFYQCN